MLHELLSNLSEYHAAALLIRLTLAAGGPSAVAQLVVENMYFYKNYQ